MLTMSYFSLLVNYYLYYYINHSRFWPILSRDLLRNKILQKRINNEKVTLLFTGVQIIKSNSIKLDPKKKFAIEGVELGSLEWTQKYASLNDKGEIIWKYDTGKDWLHYGWDVVATNSAGHAG